MIQNPQDLHRPSHVRGLVSGYSRKDIVNEAASGPWTIVEDNEETASPTALVPLSDRPKTPSPASLSSGRFPF